MGQLYNAGTDEILGETFWDLETINNKKTCRIHTNNDYELIAEDTLAEKRRSLNIDANLELSFCSGLIEVKGAAKYLNNHRSSHRVMQVSLKYHSTQRVEEIGMELLQHLTYSKIAANATHVVNRVVYGYSAFFMFERKLEDSETVEEVSGHLEAAVKKIPGASVSGEISLDANSEEKEEMKKITCRFIGDFTLKSNPTTFEGAIEAYQSIPTTLGIDGPIDPKSEIGVPQTIYMTPISSLGIKDYVAPNVVFIDGAKGIEVESVLQFLNEAAMSSNDFLTSEVCSKFQDIKNEIESFQKQLDKFKAELVKLLKGLIRDIREGAKNEKELTKLLSGIENSPFGSAMLNIYFEKKAREISILDQLLKNYTPSSTLIEAFQGSNPNLAAVLVNTKYPRVRCFSFNLERGTTHVDSMKEYLSKFEKGEFSAATKAHTPSEKEWFDDNTYVAKIRSELKKVTEEEPIEIIAGIWKNPPIYADSKLLWPINVITDYNKDGTIPGPSLDYYENGVKVA